ncbi:hypothetical protein ACEF17_09795 [Streptococcus hyovaginalis]
MVSDWQGGDISKLFPALSGKEDLSMGEDILKKGSHLSGAYKRQVFTKENTRFIGVKNINSVEGSKNRLLTDFNCEPNG